MCIINLEAAGQSYLLHDEDMHPATLLAGYFAFLE